MASIGIHAMKKDVLVAKHWPIIRPPSAARPIFSLAFVNDLFLCVVCELDKNVTFSCVADVGFVVAKVLSQLRYTR